jgi:ribosomal protein L31E
MGGRMAEKKRAEAAVRTIRRGTDKKQMAEDKVQNIL